MKSLSSIGSYMGALFAFWKLSYTFLFRKHKNMQARRIQHLERTQLLFDGDINDQNTFRERMSSYGFLYFLHPRYYLSFLYVREPEQRTQRRLGKKTSYMALYERSFRIDRMKNDVTDIKERLEEAVRRIENLEESIIE